MKEETFNHYYFPEVAPKKGMPLVDKIEVPIKYKEEFKKDFGKDLLMVNKSMVLTWLKEKKLNDIVTGEKD